MKYFKTTLLLLISINILYTFSSCTPESLTEDNLLYKERVNNGIQATDDSDKEIDKSGKED